MTPEKKDVLPRLDEGALASELERQAEALRRAENELIRCCLEAQRDDGRPPVPQLFERLEAGIIASALHLSGGNQRRAAALLGINLSTLSEKLRRRRQRGRPLPSPLTAAGKPDPDD